MYKWTCLRPNDRIYVFWSYWKKQERWATSGSLVGGWVPVEQSDHISFVGPVSSATKEWKHISNHQSLDDTSGDIEQETKLFFSLTVVSSSCGFFPYFIIFPYVSPCHCGWLRNPAPPKRELKHVESVETLLKKHVYRIPPICGRRDR